MLRGNNKLYCPIEYWKCQNDIIDTIIWAQGTPSEEEVKWERRKKN